MRGVFSQLNAIFKSGLKLDAPVITSANCQNNAFSGDSGKKRNFGVLVLCILLLLLLAAVLAFNLQQVRQNTTRLEIIARLQTHNQRLPTSFQLAISGRQSAFVQIQESQQRIHQYITLLWRGGHFRQSHIPPVSQEPLLSPLEVLIKNWQPEEKKINLVLDNRQTLVSLGQAINDINSTSHALHQKIDHLINRVLQIGDLPNELGALTAMQTLIQNVIRSVNVMLSSKLPVSEINKQLVHDRKQFLAILQAFNQEQGILNLSAIKDTEAQKTIDRINALFKTVDDNISTIQTEISGVMTAKAAANEIIQNSETILASMVALDKALQKKHVELNAFWQKALYTVTVCAALSFLALVLSLRQNKYCTPYINNDEMNKTQKAMLQLLDDMQKMADGDLTVRTVVTEDITGAIADAVNFTIEELHTLVAQVNQASAQVVDASDHAQHISSGLFAATQQQSLKIEASTVAVMDMAESINAVSDTAAESTEVAKQSLATAEKGSTAVRDSIAGMYAIRAHIQDTSKRLKRLGESSQEIGEIVALVSDLTEQTNILALNAALQATAAGEAGRGFNMIAQDVQRLAERSAEASRQISRLVKMIQRDTHEAIAAMERSTLEVAKGTQRSSAAEKALEEIEAVSKRLAKHVSNIYETSHAQTQAAKKVIENMEEILHITRKTTEGTQKTTASIQQISGFTAALKASVSSFKV